MMKGTKAVSLSLLALLTAWGCFSDDPIVSTEVLTPNINTDPYYFSFASGSGVDNLADVTFKLDTTTTPSLYSVEINSSAGVAAIVETNGDFASGVAAAGGTLQYDDGNTSAIGTGWSDYDGASYDPADNHSFTSNGTFYYLRLAAYDVVKFQVTKASEIAFDIEYAIQLNDSTAGTVVPKTIPYTAADPASFDFNLGVVVEPVDWNMGLVLAPAYIDSLDQILPRPAVIFNYANGTRVGVRANDDFDSIDSVPANTNWQSESAESRPFGYQGNYEVLVYDSDLEIVLVENPGTVYIIDDGAGAFYKLRFKDWDSGLILFEYAAL